MNKDKTLKHVEVGAKFTIRKKVGRSKPANRIVIDYCAKRSLRRTAENEQDVILCPLLSVRIIITFSRAASVGVDSVAVPW